MLFAAGNGEFLLNVPHTTFLLFENLPHPAARENKTFLTTNKYEPDLLEIPACQLVWKRQPAIGFMIPRIIHQTWKTRETPDSFRAFSQTWRDRNPGWDYRFWSDRDLLEFVAKHYPEYLELFCSYRQGVQRADAARYMLLHHFGGIYADMDMECVRSFEQFSVENRIVLCKEPQAHWSATTIFRGLPLMLFNGLMVSPAGHPFWLHLLERMVDTRHASDVLDSTGPCLLTGAWVSWPQKETVRVEEANFFTPIDTLGNSSYNLQTIPCYAIHRWAGTWWNQPKKRPWIKRKRQSLAKQFYRAKARLLGGRHLNMEAARADVSKDAISAPLPVGRNIAILVPVRDASQHLAGFLRAMEALNFPKEHLKLVFCEGDSRDDTFEQLTQLTMPLKSRYRNVILLRKNLGNHFEHSKRWLPSIQRQRRAGLAQVRNHLIDHGLDATDDWALWMDADIWKFPTDIVTQLLATKARIVTPNCVVKPGGPSFDLNSYLTKPGRRNYRYYRMIRDGLFQPPVDYPFRLKLSDLRHSDRVPLDSVGGTVLLVDATLHRGGLRFPELPYDDLIETEAFGRLARDCGITPIGLPRVEVLHVPW